MERRELCVLYRACRDVMEISAFHLVSAKGEIDGHLTPAMPRHVGSVTENVRSHSSG